MKRTVLTLVAMATVYAECFAKNFSLPNSTPLITWLVILGFVIMSCVLTAIWRRVRDGWKSKTISILQGVVLVILAYLDIWVLMVHTHYRHVADFVWTFTMDRLGG